MKLEIVLEKKESNNALLKVNVTEKDYAPKMDQKLKEYSKKAQIKGFRPGKVPTGLIKKMYGKSILVDEVNALLSESVRNYIKENDLRIIGEPLPQDESIKQIDWDNQKDFKFAFDLGLIPEFEYQLDKIKANKYLVKVDDKVIDETIENLQTQNGKNSQPDEVADGDFVAGKLKEVDGEWETDTLIPLNRVYKKYKSLFIGKKREDVVTFNLQKVFDKDEVSISHVTGVSKDEAKKMKGEYTYTITNISRSEKLPVGQELFDLTFGQGAVKSEEEFRQKVKEEIEKNFDRESDRVLIRDVQDTLIEKTKMELPTDFFKKWVLNSNQEKLTEEQLEADFDKYLRELKWSIIKNKMIEDNKLEASAEEVMEIARNMVKQQFGLSGEIPEELKENFEKIVQNYLQQDNGKGYMGIYEQVLTDKLSKIIKEQVKVKEKKVKADEFRKISAE